MKLPRVRPNEQNQLLIWTIGLVIVGLIYLVIFHDEPLPRCTMNLEPTEAAARGCPVLKPEGSLQVRWV